MSDIYDSLPYDDLIGLFLARESEIAAQRIAIDLTASPETLRPIIIACLITADGANRTKQRARLDSSPSKWTGAADFLARKILEGTARAAGGDAAPETCPECFGSGVAIVPTTLAPTTSRAGVRVEDLQGPGARRCQCETERQRKERLGIALQSIPPLYADARLSTLKARPDLHPKQAKIIEYMRENPDMNYFFCGPGDVGKTHLFWSLYRERIEQGVPAFAASLFDLIENVKNAFGTKEQVLPDLEQYAHMAIFLDDVNKARPTEYVAELVFNFMDRIYRNKHQLVVTSQLSPEDLILHFERVDSSYGLPIVRRMKNDQTVVWRMF